MTFKKGANTGTKFLIYGTIIILLLFSINCSLTAYHVEVNNTIQYVLLLCS